ncbi:hypothetical protein OUZ56_001678 [Daphnia magna]|uniref:Uncharacterized protein n=1 Tax=Daphnia magna TaxID=35525 RepID=A0ABR0A3F0_9CRUS|nr:hypothetical protein OUZ56_001678 [Daphnia magna]
MKLEPGCYDHQRLSCFSGIPVNATYTRENWMTTAAEDQTQQRPYEWIKTSGNDSTQMFLGKI